MSGPRRCFRIAAGAILLAAAVAGCAAPRATVPIAGRLDVMGPRSDFLAGGVPGGWALDGPAAVPGPQARVVESGAQWVLRLAGGDDGLVLVRHVDADMRVSPFLEWSWKVEAPDRGDHPVRLVVGFHGGRRDRGSWGAQPLVWLGTSLPPYDRALVLTWNVSALRRGHMERPGHDESGAVRYTVRGGRDFRPEWHREGVDLAALYRDAWPADEVARVRVVFVGVAVAGASEPLAADVADIVLSR